ncbi:MAG: ATP-binding protein, partial [Thermomicrobiales bacterium]
MSDYPSGTVAFLFTDIEGSTKRWEEAPEAMWVAVERHFAILRDAITAQHGVLFKTVGDAVQAAFPAVPNAVAAAVAAQLALGKEDWGRLGPLRVRMAIHAGEAMPKDGDYLAPTLNRLARVMGAGFGEQILLTETARALATPLPVGFSLRDLGQHRLRDLLEAESIFQLAGPELRSDFPALKSLDALPNNLPAQPTPLLGRERELAALHELLLTPKSRLVTLVGAGGTGKTRLALQAAAEVLDHFPDGVWWVPLADVSDPNLALPTIAAALGVRESAAEPLGATLAAYLSSRKTLLLLDNFEQVVDAAPFIDDLLDAAPGLVVIATSREPLRLRAEREYAVNPLPLPQRRAGVSLEEALGSPAVQLFVHRALSVKPSFALEAGNVADVVAICRRLDGLPLAIELAAARVRLLPPAALLARLDRSLSILTGGARDLPARQQTLRAAIAWSYDLLNAAERALFARLAIFAGGFSLEVAEAVCSAAGELPLDLLDGVDSLVQKSLLRQEFAPGSGDRFGMLATIREFALERMQDLPEVDDLRQAHADTFLTVAKGANWDDFAGQADLLHQLEADHANYRQAIGFYEQQGDDGLAKRLRLAAALAYFWWLRGHFAEGRGVL